MTTMRANPRLPAPAAAAVSIARQPIIFWHVIREITGIVVHRRTLIFQMAKREITDPFAGSMLGVMWSVLHPLIIMAVYVLVFAFIFPNNVSELDYSVFMISGYLPWMAATNSVVTGASTIRQEANLVKQVVFPLEVLPLKNVMASIVPQLVGTAFLLLYTLVRFHTLPWTWVLWPMLIFCQVMLQGGLIFLVSAIGPFLRDLREIMVVVVLIFFYLTPILYSEHFESLEKYHLTWVFGLNPFSYLVWPFRDACYGGGFDHPIAWVVLPVMSILTLVFGYRVFRKLKPQFGNAL